MFNLKKQHLIIGGITLSLLICFGLLMLYRYIKAPVYSAIRAVPEQTALIVRSNNLQGLWDALTYENSLTEAFEGRVPFVNATISLFTQLDSLSEVHSGLHTSMEEKVCIYALWPDTGNVIRSAFMFELVDAHQRNAVKAYFLQLFSSQSSVQKSPFGKGRIYTLSSAQEPFFYYAIEYGVLIISSDWMAVQTAIAQLESGESIEENPDFSEVMSVAGKKVDANLFVQYSALETVVNRVLNGSDTLLLCAIQQFAPFSELDVYIKSDRILLSGFSSSKSGTLLGAFNGQEASKEQFFKSLPKNTGSYIRYGFSDLELIMNAQQNRLGSRFQSQKSQLDKRYGIGFEKKLSLYFEDEFVLASLYADQLVLLKCSQKANASLLLRKGGKGGVKKVLGKNVYASRIGDIFTLYGVPALQEESQVWFCFYNDYLVAAHKLSAIRDYLRAMKNEGTILENKQFQALHENMEDESNISIFIDPQNGYKMFEKLLSNEAFSGVKKYYQVLCNFEGFSAQLTGTDGLFYTNAVVQYHGGVKQSSELYDPFYAVETVEEKVETNPVIDPEPEEQVAVVAEIEEEEVPVSDISNWSFKMDGKIVGKPALVRDHRVRELKVIAFDDKKQVYLVDKNGNLVWKRSLPEQPISEVFQIDYYKNGKIQYLFNSKNYLFCIDLLGRDLKNYPVKLPTSASNGIALFDYKKSRDYRIFWVGVDNKVYCYNKAGVKQSGWKIPTVSGRVSEPVQYLSSKGNAYIVIPSDNGQVLLTNTVGGLRMRIENSFANALGSQFYLNKTNSKGLLITTDQKGTLIYVPEKGAVKRTDFGRFSKEHQFIYADFNGDGSRDFIYLDGTKLKVFDRLKNVLLSHTFPIDISEKPILFKSSQGELYLGVVSSAEDRIYLFNKKGLVKKLQISGAVPFDTGRLDNRAEVSLVTAQGKEILLYEVDF